VELLCKNNEKLGQHIPTGLLYSEISSN